MRFFTYDTSFIISHKVADLPDNFLLSSVVLLELMSNAKDDSTLKQYQSLRRAYEKDDTLIVPNSEDWLLASKVMYWLEQGKRKKTAGKSLPKKKGMTQSMALDALIAVSARRHDATVVTENWDDFKAIQYYCGVKLIRGRDFLKR